MPVPLSNTGGCRPGCGSSVTDRQPVTERQAARGAHVSNTQHHMHNTQRHMHNTPCHVSNTTPSSSQHTPRAQHATPNSQHTMPHAQHTPSSQHTMPSSQHATPRAQHTHSHTRGCTRSHTHAEAQRGTRDTARQGNTQPHTAHHTGVPRTRGAHGHRRTYTHTHAHAHTPTHIRQPQPREHPRSLRASGKYRTPTSGSQAPAQSRPSPRPPACSWVLPVLFLGTCPMGPVLGPLPRELWGCFWVLCPSGGLASTCLQSSVPGRSTFKEAGHLPAVCLEPGLSPVPPPHWTQGAPRADSVGD